MKFNKVISLAMVAALSVSSVAYAKIDDILDKEFQEEVNYADDIYKYDLGLIGSPELDVEEEVPVEVLKHERSARIVSALGLITYRSDGFFYENEVLNIADFCTIAEAILGTSRDYEGKTEITHKNALDMIIKALGYDYMDEKSIMSKIYREDVLKGLSYKPEKYITRGEMARLLYNALNTPVMEIASIGNYASYESSDKITLLYHCFGLEEIEGLVTGADGISIYANKKLPENTLEINRGAYIHTDKVDTTNLLGKKVYGLYDAKETEKITFLAEDYVEQSVLVPFDKLETNGKTLSWDFDGKRGRVDSSVIKTVNLNGVAHVGSSKLSELTSGEGTVLLVASDGFNIDTAVINKYETFIVDRVSFLDEKLYFKDNLKFTLTGNTYIDINKYVNPNICVTLNGKTAKLEDLQPGFVVSVLANGNGYVRIEASDLAIEGDIEEIAEGHETLGKVYLIDDEYYAISSLYEASRKSGAKLPEIKLGLKGVFLISALGHIAYVGDVASVHKYALGKKIFTEEKKINGKIGIRLFGQNGKWENYYFANKVTVDGKVLKSFSEIKSALLADLTASQGAIVRYKLNSKKEISFFDTKIQNPEEANDVESMREVFTTPLTELAWNKGKTLPGSKYSITEDSLIFYLPEDIEDEAEYKIVAQKNLTSGSHVTFTLYNTDDFYSSNLVLYRGVAAKSFPDNSKQFLVTKVARAMDANGDDIYVITGLDAIASGVDKGWKEKKYTTTKAIAKEFPDLKAGDLCHRNFDANGRLNALKFVTRSADMMKDDFYLYDSLSQSQRSDYLIGRIAKIDAKTGKVLIESNSPGGGGSVETYPVHVRVFAIYDSVTKTAQDATHNDVGPGDRIVVYGGWGEVNGVVYR